MWHIFPKFFSLKLKKADPKHKKGTQIPKKVPMGTRVPKGDPLCNSAIVDGFLVDGFPVDRQ